MLGVNSEKNFFLDAPIEKASRQEQERERRKEKRKKKRRARFYRLDQRVLASDPVFIHVDYAGKTEDSQGLRIV